MGPSLGVLLALLAALLSGVDGYRSLPPELRECYSDDAGLFVPALPLNLPLVLDVLRKVERAVTPPMSLRSVAAALVKRFKLDGVVFSESLPPGEGVARFAARGRQRAKHRVVEELVPGSADHLPKDLLTRDERCLLHFALSNTVWDSFEPGEELLCRPPPTEKLGGELRLSFPGKPWSANDDGSCPKESGVIFTNYGTVALGSVLSAIAAALEPQSVKTRFLLDMPVSEGVTSDPDFEVDFILPRRHGFDPKSMWLESASNADSQIDNVWIATISGELAEMAIYQGPIYEERMYLGATGFWNSTMRPRVFYISQRQRNFDATRAEILGGIDGIIIAKHLEKWLKRFENFRLSQILDMYYSENGVAFDRGVKACTRGAQFSPLGPKSLLEEQTYAAAQVLAYLNSIATMSDAALRRLVVRAVDHFARYTEDHLFTAVQCRGRRRRQSRIEVLVSFDGAWTREYTADFLAVLLDDFDISMYGSKIGIIHGETGKWLLEVTNSPSKAHQVINSLTDIVWPSTIKLKIILENILMYLDRLWKEKRNNGTIGYYGHAVVLLVPHVSLSKEESQLALNALKKIKSKHPETHFVYYTCESRVEMLKPFLLSDEDRIIKTLNIDDISRILSNVPRTLRPIGCNQNVARVRLQFEDYVNPSESNTYRLHPQWRIKMKKFSLSLHGVGYGTLKVCWWNQWKLNGQRIKTVCKDLPSYGDISLTDSNACNRENPCSDTFFQILNVSSSTRCTESDCKTPDQVRYIIRMENSQCPSISAINSNSLFLISLSIFVTFYYTLYQ